MNPIPVNLAVEDELSEVVLRRLLADARCYAVGTVYGRRGNGYLRKTIVGWNRAARGCPFIVLTDLDNTRCAPSLIAEWLTVPKHPNLLFRIAVREVEAWLLSDARLQCLPVGICKGLLEHTGGVAQVSQSGANRQMLSSVRGNVELTGKIVASLKSPSTDF